MSAPSARQPAVLVCEDGRAFRGQAYGHRGVALGEAVFTTGMTGYQETLTDPSFHRQIVVMTAPHVGNTGWNDEDDESDRIWAAGYVVRDPARIASNHRSRRGLEDELVAQRVVGIAGVDTRALTRHLRERGTMRAGIASTDSPDLDDLLRQVRAQPPMTGADLAPEVSARQAYVVPAAGGRPRFRVAALDLGIKAASARMLAAAGCEVRVVPVTGGPEELLAGRPDGILVSNGPGDPSAADHAVRAVRAALASGIPVLGICLGHQVLARALGLGTHKLGYGHRGVNQPVKDLATDRVAITSHNHGFAVTWPGGLDQSVGTPYGRVAVSHVALNDGVVEGLRCADVPAISVQHHPEAAPGPHDATGVFGELELLMARRRDAAA
ncbi:MAG: glutamine-hydrolyzing carbamoyl-phosphate synthase small subunit [Frankiaceae bacterium]